MGHPCIRGVDVFREEGTREGVMSRMSDGLSVELREVGMGCRRGKFGLGPRGKVNGSIRSLRKRRENGEGFQKTQEYHIL